MQPVTLFSRHGWRPLWVCAGLACMPGAVGATTVATYHYDNLRTGWDRTETALTPASVGGPQFGLLHQVPLDEQVDAQPLLVTGEVIGGSTHDVVYVATEANTVYAIDAASGAVLLRRNFGRAVPISALPGGCSNNSDNVGINSTPVIDTAAHRLYAVTYTYELGQAVFRMHALDLAGLNDVVAPVTVSASAPISGGGSYSFTAGSSRQRAALIETGGNVYAGFSSFCDVNANRSRGWVLGWNAATLAPLPAVKLIDQVGQAPNGFYLSSIWMSGFGIASDDRGSLFFVTGNSGSDYNSVYNLSESVVRLSSDLTTAQGFFTPGNHTSLDQSDADFGAGGVLLLPDQPGAYPHLAVAAGKGNPLYLMDRDNLGGVNTPPKALRTYTNNGCRCGESFFEGSDKVGRVVTSTGRSVMVWRVQTQPSPGLVQESVGPNLASGQDPGFFTTISSNGLTAGTAVIWAVPHPDDNDQQHRLVLTAFDPAHGSQQIFSGAAGSWPFYGNANANVVPVVANGRVFVAGFGQLSIFGLSAPGAHVAFAAPAAPVMAAYTGTRHQIYGRVVSVGPSMLSLRTRTGVLVSVDVRGARGAADATELAAGNAALARGDYDASGRFTAQYVLHAKDNPVLWGADR